MPVRWLGRSASRRGAGLSGKLFAGSLTGGAWANVVGRVTADAFELASVDGSSLRLRGAQPGAVVSGTFAGTASQGVWKGEWRLRPPPSIVAPEVQEKAGRGETQDIRVNLATRAMWYEAASQARLGSRLRPDVLGPRLATAYAEARAALAAKVGRSAEKLGPYQSGASSFVVDAASPAEISVLASSGMVASISPEPGERLEPNIDKSVVLIDQPEAQAAGYTGAGYAIAIVDSGIDYTKDVFGPCSKPGVPATTCRVVANVELLDDDGNDRDPFGHGTNVADVATRVAGTQS